MEPSSQQTAQGRTTVNRKALVWRPACRPSSPAACGTRQRASSAGVCAGVTQRGGPGTGLADSSRRTPPSSRRGPDGSHRVVSCGARPAGSQAGATKAPAPSLPRPPRSWCTIPQNPLSHLCATKRTAQGRECRLPQGQTGYRAHRPLHCCPQRAQPAHRSRHSTKHVGKCSPGPAPADPSPTGRSEEGRQPLGQAGLYSRDCRTPNAGNQPQALVADRQTGLSQPVRLLRIIAGGWTSLCGLPCLQKVEVLQKAKRSESRIHAFRSLRSNEGRWTQEGGASWQAEHNRNLASCEGLQLPLGRHRQPAHSCISQVLLILLHTRPSAECWGHSHE